MPERPSLPGREAILRQPNLQTPRRRHTLALRCSALLSLLFSSASLPSLRSAPTTLYRPTALSWGVSAQLRHARTWNVYHRRGAVAHYWARERKGKRKKEKMKK